MSRTGKNIQLKPSKSFYKIEATRKAFIGKKSQFSVCSNHLLCQFRFFFVSYPNGMLCIVDDLNLEELVELFN